MKKLFLMVLVACLFLSGSSLKTKEKTKSKVLVQLFTSQGCSSCPPADALLGKMIEKYKNQNVYFLAYHVDYWDRLGWKDPFGKAQFTHKQYEYGKAFKLNSVYTPQAVVNGKYQFTGSDREKLESAIVQERQHGRADHGFELTLSKQKDPENEASGAKIKIGYITGEWYHGEKVYLALFIKKQRTAVENGENSGKKLIDYHVVLAEKNQTGARGEVFFQLPRAAQLSDYGVLAYVQNKQNEIIATNEIELH